MKAKKFFLILLALIFTSGIVWAWGPGTGGNWGSNRWSSSSGYNYIYAQVNGIVSGVKTMAGPGRRGLPWIVLEVKTDQGKNLLVGIGPQWWGTPPELKQGVKVSITTFYPPGWQYRGVPYSLACSISFPDVGKHYSLRPCGWWRNSRFPTKNSK